MKFQGTDITEAFESHHITPKAGELLKDFYVSDAVDPRNYFITHDKNGFYQTLKKRVAEKLKTIDHEKTQNSKLIHDLILFTTFFSAIMMARSENQVMLIVWALISAQCLAWLANISQNFVHQTDNWRMYTANISVVTWRELRVFHVLVSCFLC